MSKETKNLQLSMLVFNSDIKYSLFYYFLLLLQFMKKAFINLNNVIGTSNLPSVFQAPSIW